MPRARWWVVGGLSGLTALVIVLDLSGVLFEPDAVTSPPSVTPPITASSPDAPHELSLGVSGERSPGRGTAFAAALDEADGRVLSYVAPLTDPTDELADSDKSLRQVGTPASTLKLLTAIAVLDTFESPERLVTSVMLDPAANRVVLVGGGDTTMTTERVAGSSAPSLAELARNTARALRRANIERVDLAYDSSLFTGPRTSPQWEPTYVSSGVIAPVTALMTDEGRTSIGSDSREAEPDRAAAEQFASLLAEQGIEGRGSPAPSSSVGLDVIAEVSSAPVDDLVERMLRDSDNQLAESLGRLAALRHDLPASFEGASDALTATAQTHGVTMAGARVFDASGLSRDNRLSPLMLVQALHAAAIDPDLVPMLTGLPVAGFDGTLADRYDRPPAMRAAGLVRAKTGTLTGVAAEAGVVTTCDGVILAFAVVINDVIDGEAAQASIENATASFTTCR
jgi:D-alanyl-D-alanine carboxypeptidase/D-alanyl-D-alanine-endopeptidase (penicillin-binding protein 4)